MNDPLKQTPACELDRDNLIYKPRPSQLGKYRNQLESDAHFLDGLANDLDSWAEQSRSGSWSTHQVQDNIARANDCRRRAAVIRKLLSE
jgi:hypothetical protein